MRKVVLVDRYEFNSMSTPRILHIARSSPPLVDILQHMFKTTPLRLVVQLAGCRKEETCRR